MDCQTLLPTVYVAPQGRKLNTIMEEDQAGRNQSSWTTDSTTGPPTSSSLSFFKSPQSDNFPTPRAHDFPTVPSPSSSVDSRTLSWMSSESGATRESGTDFEDLYDTSEDERYQKREAPAVVIHRPRSYSGSNTNSFEGRNKLPNLVIPPSGNQVVKSLKKSNFVPVSPPPKVPISPAMLSLLAQPTPSFSATPSLDGSQISDLVANSETPSTPSSEMLDQSTAGWDNGVQLNPEALATLQSLSNDETESNSGSCVEIDPASAPQMTEAVNVEREENMDLLTPCSNQSLSELTKLEIPSPGGFFSSLAGGARHTWCPSSVPPSSTTAEQFYACPWNAPADKMVEQVVEVNLEASDEPTTAQQLTPRAPVKSSSDDITEKQVTVEYDEAYETTLKETASSNIDRTSLWLSMQETYLAKLRGDMDPENTLQTPSEEVPVGLGSPRSSTSSPRKRNVSFADDVIAKDEASKKEAIFWKGCQHLVHSTSPKDALVHGGPRNDAIQTDRICSAAAHRERLLGKYISINKVLTEDPEVSPTLVQKQNAKAEKERHALEQMAPAAWNVMAIKTLNGGQLISAPAAKRIARKAQPTQSGAKGRARILDLGGPAVCDWAWFCAEEFPSSKVYTLITKGTREPQHSTLRGPSNHRQVAVQSLWKFPFPDNYFDVISARSLHMLLKIDKPSTETEDEYDLCMRECLRCLKPGGFLEFSLLDSDIIGAGPLGSAKSVEFGFSLKTMGYDSTPTRAWLGRLRKAGFVGVKRSWMFLPMGNPTSTARTSSETQGSNSEESVMGSTTDVASVTGLVGSLAWEKWMLKLQMESGKDEDNLLGGVAAVVQEGRNCGAGWRSLSGWARKPLN
ncbi:MAG: hypothetical protein M4579_005907 [Chaenotheca gracillima]|nr:MAG: hypothetical protein M4579_005907 [Chaenotheca gracillima]